MRLLTLSFMKYCCALLHYKKLISQTANRHNINAVIRLAINIWVVRCVIYWFAENKANGCCRFGNLAPKCLIG